MSRRHFSLRPGAILIGLVLALGTDPIRLDIASTAFALGEDDTSIEGMVHESRSPRGVDVTHPGDDDQPTIGGRKRGQYLAAPEPTGPGLATVRRGGTTPNDAWEWSIRERLQWLLRLGLGSLR